MDLHLSALYVNYNWIFRNIPVTGVTFNYNTHLLSILIHTNILSQIISKQSSFISSTQIVPVHFLYIHSKQKFRIQLTRYIKKCNCLKTVIEKFCPTLNLTDLALAQFSHPWFNERVNLCYEMVHQLRGIFWNFSCNDIYKLSRI